MKSFHSKLTSLPNFAGQIVRLLYSPYSRILSVHLVNLSPYHSYKAAPSSAPEDLGPPQAVFLQRGLDLMKGVREDHHS